jgi:prevent-host-death family protein
METVTIHAAKTHLSQLLARVERGEEIILARGKHPVARLVPYRPTAAKRQFGALRGSSRSAASSSSRWRRTTCQGEGQV